EGPAADRGAEAGDEEHAEVLVPAQLHGDVVAALVEEQHAHDPEHPQERVRARELDQQEDRQREHEQEDRGDPARARGQECFELAEAGGVGVFEAGGRPERSRGGGTAWWAVLDRGTKRPRRTWNSRTTSCMCSQMTATWSGVAAGRALRKAVSLTRSCWWWSQ